MATATMLELFQAARNVSVPIVGISTADQAATIEDIRAKYAESPLVQWDAAQGLRDVNKLGKDALGRAQIKQADTVGFVDAMLAAQGLPKGTVLFAHNAHRQLASMEPAAIAQHVQAVANLRDTFKKDFRCLVLLAPAFVAPPELRDDICVLEHELPGQEALATVVAELHNSAKLEVPKGERMVRAVEAITGVSMFAAEQQVAMSLREDGLDVNLLWERKRVTIEQTAGMSVYRGPETFDDVVGCDAVKQRLRSIGRGKRPIGVVAWIDEGSDVFSSSVQGGNDQKMDQQKLLLTDMEKYKWPGVILCGVSGTGKSLVGRAMGNEFGVPTVELDFGAMEAKYVGESEQNARAALRTMRAIGDGNAFFVLTCNSLHGIRPQFQRRFRRGVFFFDLLDEAQQMAMWKYHMGRNGLAAQPLPKHEGWTGAEIADCCEDAANTGATLVEAGRFIMPVSQSRHAETEAMRLEAHGRFLDANKVGFYSYTERAMEHILRAIEIPKGKVN